MYAYKDVLELAGYTTRLYTLLSTLHNLPIQAPFTSSADTVELKDVDVIVPGKPDTILVKELSFELKIGKGEHLMITGTNGVGKTAIARVVAGLWAGSGGELTRPPLGVSEVFVVPQRAYMVTGTLIDQVIYPHSYAQHLKSGKTEAQLMEILHAVHLAYLPDREGGWATRKEWRDVLSGGEKQRMGLARAFYHRPKFALLDECTSAVSSDVEGSMYQHAKSLGITLITISLRPSLAKYHTHLLTLNGDGQGSWTCTRVGTAEERMEIDREIIDLESKLAEVNAWEERVKELNRQLSTHTTS